MEHKALKQKLEAYLCREMPAGTVIGDPKWWAPKIAAAIKEALAQPEQEPVEDVVEYFADGTRIVRIAPQRTWVGHKIQVKQEQEEYLSKAYRLANELRCHLAIAPAPQRTWVGLTDEQIADYLGDEYHAMTESELRFFRLGEAAAKEKNNG